MPAAEERASAWRTVAVPILLAAGLLGASWLKSDLANNDFERFDDLRLTFLFFALVGGACFAYALLALEPRPLSAGIVALGFTAAALLLLGSFPVGSKDVLLYAFTGRIWNTYGANPYLLAPAAFPTDPWRSLFDVVWAEKPSPYGPLFLWQARAADALAGGGLATAVALHKATATAALAAAIVLAARVLPKGDARLALLAWNPLLLFESAGSGHNDAVVLLLVLGAAMLQLGGGPGRRIAVPALLALAIWYKWYALLFVPAFAVDVARDAGRDALRRWAIAATASTAEIGAVLFAPLLGSLPDVARRLFEHENLREIFPLQLSPVLRALFEVLAAAGLYETGAGRAWFDAVRFSLFGGAVVATLWLQAKGRLRLVEAIALLSLAFTLLVVTVLWPWHLEVPVFFALLSEGARLPMLGVAVTVVALSSYFFTFTWATVLVAALAAGLWGLRASRRA